MSVRRETLVVRASTLPGGREPIRIASNPDKDLNEIERDIESTRREMAHTINQLEDRLRPQRLVDNARETVRDATIGKVERTMDDVRFRAQTTSSGILGTIRANPLAATIAAASLGWLWMSRSSGSNQHPRSFAADGSYGMYGSRTGPGGYSSGGAYEPRSSGPAAKIGDTVEGTKESARKLAEGARGTVADATDTAAEVVSSTRERAGEVVSATVDRAGEMAEHVVDRAQEAAWMAQMRTSAAQNDVQRLIHENPLGAAAVAVAIGATVGLLTPSTEPESRLFGSAGEQLRERAMETAQQAGEKVQRVAQEAGRAAQREATA